MRPEGDLEGILQQVQAPQQYTGGEWNSAPGDPRLPSVTLVYPDTYEIGMSNFGLAVVRHLLLASGRFGVRRAFCPAPDMLAAMSRRGIGWPALEDGLPAASGRVLAFGVPCEILFPNILMLLGLAGMPPRSADRGEGHPVVVAGGGGLSNPLPLSPFVDAFYLGDAETGAVAMMDALCGDGPKAERLLRASETPGVWVPSLGRRRVVWQRSSVLLESDAPVCPVVPTARIVHDRAVVEIARGCTRGCRFCQATQLSRPVRERGVAEIETIARRAIASTGWEDAGLLTLSFSDYSDLHGLLGTVGRLEDDLSVNISLPSLRPDTFVRLAGLRRMAGRVTMAPEAGSETLRRRLNKNLGDDVILEAVETAFGMGATGVKLYFMVGLPGETDADLRAIADLSAEAARAASRAGRRGGGVTISLSPFIPKPHTPLQWCGQLPPAEVRRRISTVRSMARRFTVGSNDPDVAFLEGLLGLGDDSATPALMEEALSLGAGFEGWREHFKRDLWTSCADRRPELIDRLREGTDPSTDPPWSFVEAGSSVEFLREEHRRFLEGTPTPDCRESGCHSCGACAVSADPADRRATDPIRAAACAPAPSRGAAGGAASRSTDAVAATLRVRFGRAGLSRFTSQLDLTRLWMRTARRSGLPVATTRGHVTRPRLRFGPALPLGFESVSEYIDILLADGFTLRDPFDLGRFLPAGFTVTGARLIEGRMPSPEGEAVTASYRLFCGRHAPDAEVLLRGAEGLAGLEAVDDDSIDVVAALGSPASRPDRILAAATDMGDMRLLVRRTGICGTLDGCPVPLLSMHEGVDLV